jgi:hypothetical protein
VHGKREDPKKSISTVKDGYGQAAALLGTGLVDGSTLWVDASGPDTWVKVLIADDSLINEAFSRRFLRVTFIRDGDPCERVFAGKSVLSAYRLPPEDVAQ